MNELICILSWTHLIALATRSACQGATHWIQDRVSSQLVVLLRDVRVVECRVDSMVEVSEGVGLRHRQRLGSERGVDSSERSMTKVLLNEKEDCLQREEHSDAMARGAFHCSATLPPIREGRQVGQAVAQQRLEQALHQESLSRCRAPFAVLQKQRLQRW